MKKLIFMGTSEFACRCLESLLEDNIKVDMVVTRPDSIAGRNQRTSQPPVKRCARALGLDLWQPENINSEQSVAKLENLAPDLLIVVAYGKVLSKRVLSIPSLGAVNVHASLLPDLRGAAPVEWALMRGYTETGVTTMFMDAGLDTGDIILQQKLDIPPQQTGGELRQRLAVLAQQLLPQTVNLIYQGKAPRQPQPQHCPAYAPILDRSLERIDWTQSAEDIGNRIRALAPKPACYTVFRGKRVKILAAVASPGYADPGAVLLQDKKMLVGTGNGLLELTSVQPEGRKVISAQDFANGYRVEEGELFQ